MVPLFARAAIGETINLAAGREIRIKDLATWINELTKKDADIVFKERRNWDKKTRLLASIDKARKTLSYEPKTEFEKGLGQVHNWFVQN